MSSGVSHEYLTESLKHFDPEVPITFSVWLDRNEEAVLSVEGGSLFTPGIPLLMHLPVTLETPA